VSNADARDHRRVAKDGWRGGEVVKEPNSGAKKDRRDVDADFVEEASIQQLLDRVGAMDPNGLSGGGGFGLASRRFRCRRSRSGQSSWVAAIRRDVVGKDERWSPRVITAPALGDVERAAPGEHRTKSGRETANVLGARPDTLNVMGCSTPGVDFDVPRVEVPVEHFGHAIAPVGNVSVERHGHDRDNFDTPMFLSILHRSTE
jgi:hypothetical protein